MNPQSVLPRELQLTAVMILVGFLGWVVHLIRSARLSLRDSLLWVLSTFAALLMTVFPQTLKWVAIHLSIEVPSNALFAAAIVYLAINLLSTTIAVSGAHTRVRRLTQECTLLRAELNELRAQVGNSERKPAP